MITVVLAGLIGVAGGLLAGYLGGHWDAIIMRLVDIFLAFPVIILATAIVAVRGPGLTNVAERRLESGGLTARVATP